MQYGTYATIDQLAQQFDVPTWEVTHTLVEMQYSLLDFNGKTRVRLNKADLALLDLYFTCMKEPVN